MDAEYERSVAASPRPARPESAAAVQLRWATSARNQVSASAILNFINLLYTLCFYSIFHTEYEPGTVPIPIGNNTGSLPDLTSVHSYPSPLHTPLDPDQEHQGSSPYSSVSAKHNLT